MPLVHIYPLEPPKPGCTAGKKKGGGGGGGGLGWVGKNKNFVYMRVGNFLKPFLADPSPFLLIWYVFQE